MKNNASSRRSINTGDIERVLSIASGALLLGYGIYRRSRYSLPLGLVGAVALYRGLSGHCPAYSALKVNRARLPGRSIFNGISIRHKVQIQQPVDQVYQYWRQLDNLPRFIRHLESVTAINDTRSRWIAKAGAGAQPVAWEAELLFERLNQLLVWRSLPGYPVDSQVVVEFVPVLQNQSTEVIFQLIYAPPEEHLGVVQGDSFRYIFSASPDAEVREDLARLKTMLQEL